jgi:hypothetical protein
VEELKKDELDMIPTREKGSSKKPKTKIKEFPIFFKNSKVESSIPK